MLHIADGAAARLVFIGDRRQLPAVGIGGVLDKVARWAPEQIELAGVHRFRRNIAGDDGELVKVPDTEYAELSLQIRSGLDTADVFNELVDGGHVMLWDTEADAIAHLAVTIADRHLAGESPSVSMATNETASQINGVAHDRLVDRGVIDMTGTRTAPMACRSASVTPS